MKKQTQMIVEMIEAVAEAHEAPFEKAYDIVLTWMAVQCGAEEQLATDGIKTEAYEKMVRLFDIDSLREEKWDWLGEAGEYLGVFKQLPSREDVELKVGLAVENMDFSQNDMPQSILIENTWTGRDILALHSYTKDAAIFFGMEPELRLYRTAVLNNHIHGIHAFILNADNTVSRELNSENWRYSNLWNPVKWDRYQQA